MTLAGWARACVAAVLLACLPAHSQSPASVATRVGIVWWPADPSDAVKALKSDMEDCLTARIRDIAPEIIVVRQSTIRDALFPLLEPATQPATEEAFAAMLARKEVRERLSRHGLRYLVAFTGDTLKAKPDGFVLCGAGYGGGGCLGFAWRNENTALDAALWSLEEGAAVQRREGAKAEGVSVMPAFIFPLPILARTQTAACHELGTRLAVAIRQIAAAQPVDR
ncbi:MAG: hypothetical protein K9J76_04245 [Polaromonas sp.]|nr:hypothetical protein [Polaromonas sp.]